MHLLCDQQSEKHCPREQTLWSCFPKVFLGILSRLAGAFSQPMGSSWVTSDCRTFLFASGCWCFESVNLLKGLFGYWLFGSHRYWEKCLHSLLSLITLVALVATWSEFLIQALVAAELLKRRGLNIAAFDWANTAWTCKVVNFSTVTETDWQGLRNELIAPAIATKKLFDYRRSL